MAIRKSVRLLANCSQDTRTVLETILGRCASLNCIVNSLTRSTRTRSSQPGREFLNMAITALRNCPLRSRGAISSSVS